MVNRPKAIGTWTETQTVKHSRANGFGGADEMTHSQRLTLSGANDQGDVALCPGAMIEVKGGARAETASDALVAAFLVETEIERVNRGADIALLVMKRKGKGATSVGQWWAVMPGWTFLWLGRGAVLEAENARERYADLPAVRMTFDDALNLMRRAGYGDPIERTAA